MQPTTSSSQSARNESASETAHDVSERSMPVATHRAEQTTPNAPAAMTWVHGPSGHRVNARDKVSRSGSVAERNHPATTSPVEPDTNFNMASPVGAKASVSNGQAQVSSEAPSEAPVSGEAGRLEPLREAAALDDNATQLGEVTQQTRIEDVLLAQVSTATDGALEGGRGAAAGVGDSVPAASSAEAGASVLSGNAGLVALGVLGAAGLASHGGGSSSSTQTTTPATGLTVSLTGGLTAGPVVKSLHVTAYDRNGNKLGEADTDASGKYTLTIASSKVFNGGAVLLQVSDPAGGANDYRDEATGQLADITDLRAVVFVSAPTSGTSVTLPSVQITPLTTLAAELLAPLPTSTGSVWSLSSDKATGNAVQAANRQVGLLFGLSTTLDVAADVTQATPQTVISSDGSPVAATQSNAYGKALAVLSHAQDAALNATDPVPLTIQKLAASLNGTSNLTSSSTQALNFSSAVATQFSTAALTAASKGELTASDVGTIQTATAGGSSSGIAALNFKFTQAPTLSTLDPANALGQKVYTLYKGGTSNMVPEGGALYADNVGNQAVTYVLAGADKDAFEFVVNANPTTDNSQVLGWLKLKAPTDGTQPIQAQKNGGYTYHVDLKAVADPFNTPDNTADDISVTQSLSLKVQDETKPSLPNTPTVVLNTDTQASGGNLARVGGTKAAGNAFITVTDPDVASIPLGVKHHLTITLENTGNTLGAKGQVVKEWDAVGSPHTIALSAEELTTLGEGTIKVTTTDQAIDWAENTSALQTTTQQFVLDTTVASPTVAVADNKAASASSTPLSGDGFIRISGLEAGATWVYQIVNADTSSVVKAWSSTPLTVNSGASTDPVTYTAYTSGTTTLYRTDLNLSSLGSGNYSIEVRQTDSLLNASQPKSLAFQLNLEAPQGVDAQIDKFIVYKDTSSSPEPDNTTLLLGDHARVDVSGKIRGTPKAGEKIQYNLNAGNENSWVDIPASAIQSDGTFTLTDLTLPVGNGVIRISQTDNLGHRTLLSSRAFVNQDVNVLTPPRLQWLGAATLEDGTATSASPLRVKIDNPDGLSERAVVQYLLLDHQLGTTETVASDAWRATIDQPTASGTYYLYARQWDVMTGYASEVDVTSPLSIHYVKPETTTAITGLTLASVDGNGHVTSSALDEPAVLSNGKLAALTVVVELEAGLNEGSTLSMRWGNQLQHYTLTTDDVSSKKAYITWDKADLLKQPGNTTVQAWVTDLTGQVSAKTSQSWFVGDSSTTVPAILGWSTKTAESDDYAPDTDNTINAKESAFGVELSLQLPTYETGGTTPLTWANSSANGGKAFQLSLFSKTAAGDWTVFPIKSATFTAESLTDGVVHWVVSKDVWDGLSGARDWKVQITNFSQAPDAPLYITETGLSELLVDLAPPKSISMVMLEAPADGNPLLAGLSKQQVDIQVSYIGMTAGDVLVFSSQPAGAGSPVVVLRYEIKASDILPSSPNTFTVSVARDAISQGHDGTYNLSLSVTDAAGNTAVSNSRPQVTVDTERPGAPSLEVAGSEDAYLNASEDHVTVTLTWPVGGRVASDQVQWLLGGSTLDATKAQLKSGSLTATSATYTFLKSDLGSEGVKELRAVLKDASGNLGEVSTPLTLTLDSEAHAPAQLQWAAGSQPFFKSGSQMQLDVVDAQLQLGDVVTLALLDATGAPITPSSWTKFTVSDADILTHNQVVLTLHQGSGSTGRGVYDIGNAPGAYSVQATVTDRAGNTSVKSVSLNLVVDTDAPTNKVSTDTVALSKHAVVVDGNAPTGHHWNFITNSASQTVTATLDHPLSAASATSGAESLWGRIAPDSSTDDSGWVDLSASVTTRGDVTSLAWNTMLTAGTHALQLQVRDQSGNRGPLIEQTYVLDTTAPSLTIVDGSVQFSADTAPTGTASGDALTSDLKTRTKAQTISLDLSAALATDANNSSTWGAGAEHLWGSLDNGVTWTDLNAFVNETGHLSWTGVSLSSSSTLKFKVMDVAGNAGALYSKDYTLDTTSPSLAIASIRFQDDTGLDTAGRSDFITSSTTTAIDFVLNRALLAEEHVYIKLGESTDAIDVTQQLKALGAMSASSARIASGRPFTLLDIALQSGSHTLTWWVEDSAGNASDSGSQVYVSAPTAPTFDLDSTVAASPDAHTSLNAPSAQHGVSLASHVQVNDVPAGVAQVILTYASLNDVVGDNGVNERLLVTPGVDVALNGVSSTAVSSFTVAGVDGLVHLEPASGSELHFTKWTSGGLATSFTADEVTALLFGLRYFNSAAGDSIKTGDRQFSLQLIDVAANHSDSHTSTISLQAAAPTAGEATLANDSLTGTAVDDVLLGLAGNDVLIGGKGNDVLWGYGGNATRTPTESNTFQWNSGDASSSMHTNAATDLIRDFMAWNGTSGDKLDIHGLLQGYTSGAELASWISVENHATSQGVEHSTRITVHVDGTTTGATQIIELQGVQLSTTNANDLVASGLLRVL